MVPGVSTSRHRTELSVGQREGAEWVGALAGSAQEWRREGGEKAGGSGKEREMLRRPGWREWRSGPKPRERGKRERAKRGEGERQRSWATYLVQQAKSREKEEEGFF